MTYSDPSNVFSSVSKELAKHLPLRNLNWNSPSRPLRSIPSLHVELVADDDFSKTQDFTTENRPSDQNREIASSRGRRHQIPGLRQSPYLKIYLLKCEDIDRYRNVARKEIRDWVTANTPQTQSSGNLSTTDNHDAFEWLIVHVLPDRAASELGGGSKVELENAKRSTSSRWSSRTSTGNLVEKIRTDFNGTSKNAIDRVAQVTAGSTSESGGPPGKVDNASQIAWEVFFSKIKSLILASFDQRVAQYEDDIKEKEAQRKMPGWNFNTFFVLKEGLARGFESVGLLEDALAGYRELSTELDSIVHEQNSTNDAGSQFDDYTEDLYNELTHVRSPTSDSKRKDHEHRDFGDMILNTKRKDFRQLILSNNISIFDFRCYLFGRQMRVLLRLANASRQKSTGQDTSDDSTAEAMNLIKPSDHEPENLLVLAEACQFASDFLASIVAQMRKDFAAARKRILEQTDEEGIKDSDDDSADGQATTENLINSWTISATHAVLMATESQSLSTQLRPILGQLQIKQESDSTFSHRAQGLPDRRSSLPPNSPSKTRTGPSTASSVVAIDALRLLPPSTPHPGARELAAERGNLILSSRRALSSCVYRVRGWSGGLARVVEEVKATCAPLETIDLERRESTHHHQERQESPKKAARFSAYGCHNGSLEGAVSSESLFNTIFAVCAL